MRGRTGTTTRVRRSIGRTAGGAPSAAGAASLAVAFALALLPCAAAAQARPPADTLARATRRADSLALDSLAARLREAEAAIALLRAQLAGESESAVRASSRLRLELSARLLTNAFATFGRVNAVDGPQVALPAAAGAPPHTQDALGATVRQSRLGAGLVVNDVLGGAFAADVDVDFAGGAQGAAGERLLFPEPRLRTARARLRWARTELLIGSETPLVSDLDPMSLAAVSTPNFSGAGNLWNWLPQLRLTRTLGTTRLAGRRVEWAAQGALLEPFAGLAQPGEPDGVDAGERSRRPFIQGRLRARWGDAAVEREPAQTDELSTDGGEVGIGVHRGWVADGSGRLATSRALTADLRVAVGRRVELRGEGYAGGRLLRGLGGGAIAQAFGRPADDAPPDAVGAPLRDAAAWLQVNVQPSPVLLGGAGCGVNVVAARERPLRERNAVCAAHVRWRPIDPIVAGMELRTLHTRYASGTVRAHHLNLAFGVEF